MAGETGRRRRFFRVPGKHYILVRKVHAKGLPKLTTTHVVAQGGCMFVLDESFGVDTILALLLLVGKSVVEVKARVAYELVREDGAFEIGTEFMEISSEDKATLERFLPAAMPPERP